MYERDGKVNIFILYSKELYWHEDDNCPRLTASLYTVDQISWLACKGLIQNTHAQRQPSKYGRCKLNTSWPGPWVADPPCSPSRSLNELSRKLSGWSPQMVSFMINSCHIHRDSYLPNTPNTHTDSTRWPFIFLEITYCLRKCNICVISLKKNGNQESIWMKNRCNYFMSIVKLFSIVLKQQCQCCY